MVRMFIYVFLYVVMLENLVFEIILNMIGVLNLYIWNGIVFESVIWIMLLNGDCVCYSNKRIGWYCALGCFQWLFSNTIWYVGAPLRCFQLRLYTLLTFLHNAPWWRRGKHNYSNDLPLKWRALFVSKIPPLLPRYVKMVARVAIFGLSWIRWKEQSPILMSDGTWLMSKKKLANWDPDGRV